MSIDTYKLHKLAAKEFDKLYSRHSGKWNRMVAKAVEGVRACIGDNESVKAGDVIAAVEHGILGGHLKTGQWWTPQRVFRTFGGGSRRVLRMLKSKG